MNTSAWLPEWSFFQPRMPCMVGWYDFALSPIFSISLLFYLAAVIELQELTKLWYVQKLWPCVSPCLCLFLEFIGMLVHKMIAPFLILELSTYGGQRQNSSLYQGCLYGCLYEEAIKLWKREPPYGKELGHIGWLYEINPSVRKLMFKTEYLSGLMSQQRVFPVHLKHCCR